MPTRFLNSQQAHTLLKRYRTSGLSQSAFCRKHGISSSLFTYWMPRLQPPKNPSQPSFQEISLPTFPISEQCILTLSSGARLEFPASQLSSALAILTQGAEPC